MSLQPSNIPQLQNVGLNPAASMLSSGISTLVGAEQAEKDRRNKLLQSLLGGAVNMGEQVLRNRGNLAMTEAQIMSPAQQALALNRLATGAAGLGQAGGISGGVDNVLGQLGIGNRQSPQKELLDGTPSSDQMGLDADGGITGVPQGQEFTKTPQGAFQLGASQQTVLPPTSAGIPADLPLGMSKNLAQIQRAQTGSDLNIARQSKTYKDIEKKQQEIDKFDRLYGGDIYNPDENPIAISRKTKKPFVINGRQLKNTDALANARESYKDSTMATPREITNSIKSLTEGSARVKKLGQLLKRAQPLVGTNAAKTMVNKMKSDPNVLLTTNDKTGSLMRQIQKELDGIVGLQLTVAIQGSRPTDYDALKIQETLPNLFTNKELYNLATRDIMADLGGAVLDASMIVDRPDITQSVGKMVEDLTGQKYEYGEQLGIGYEEFAGDGAGSLDDDIDSYINELRQQRQAGF